MEKIAVFSLVVLVGVAGVSYLLGSTSSVISRVGAATQSAATYVPFLPSGPLPQGHNRVATTNCNAVCSNVTRCWICCAQKGQGYQWDYKGGNRSPGVPAEGLGCYGNVVGQPYLYNRYLGGQPKEQKAPETARPGAPGPNTKVGDKVILPGGTRPVQVIGIADPNSPPSSAAPRTPTPRAPKGPREQGSAWADLGQALLNALLK